MSGIDEMGLAVNCCITFLRVDCTVDVGVSVVVEGVVVGVGVEGLGLNGGGRLLCCHESWHNEARRKTARILCTVCISMSV